MPSGSTRGWKPVFGKHHVQSNTDSSDALHLPRSAPIEAYGKGGFAFADMSHRGSLLCLPDAIWAWQVTKPAEIDEYSLDRGYSRPPIPSIR